jgi:hypothetical protein
VKTLFIALSLLAGCATVPVANTSNACGDPCANLACPSAFFCTVDSHCAARCQPEGMKPGGPP